MVITSSKKARDINLPTSKSYAARALILGCLKKDYVVVSDIPNSRDTKELIAVLTKLSLLKSCGDKVIINKSFPEDEARSEEVVDLYLGEGGTSIRFLLSFLCLGETKYKIRVHPRFKMRPYLEQLDILKSLGADYELSDEDDTLCFIQGPISLPDELDVNCSKTTQIASSLVLINSVFNKKLIFKNLNSSEKYLEMSEFIVMNMKNEFQVPVDMSSASYFIALVALGFDYKLKNIFKPDPLQADSYLFKTLAEIGYEFSFSPYLKIEKIKRMKAFHADGARCIDLVPTLCFLASFIDGESSIMNIDNLIYKETNRLEGIKSILSQFGVSFRIEENTLFICGGKPMFSVQTLDVFPDHRMVMMGALFLKVTGGGELNNSTTVDKSFPEFFSFLN